MVCPVKGQNHFTGKHAMKSFTEHLITYAKYHRDPRNIATHLFGVPVIVMAVFMLFSRLNFTTINGFDITLALVFYAVSVLYYLSLNVVFAVLMALISAAFLYIGTIVADLSFAVWLATSLGIFIVGWVFQFIGHFYEGKKPAFLDDLVGLMIGPLFVLAECLFKIGMFSELKLKIESSAGKVAKQT